MGTNKHGIINDWKFPMWDDVADEFVQFKSLVVTFHVNTRVNMIMGVQAIMNTH